MHDDDMADMVRKGSASQLKDPVILPPQGRFKAMAKDAAFRKQRRERWELAGFLVAALLLTGVEVLLLGTSVSVFVGMQALAIVGGLFAFWATGAGSNRQPHRQAERKI